MAQPGRPALHKAFYDHFAQMKLHQTWFIPGKPLTNRLYATVAFRWNHGLAGTGMECSKVTGKASVDEAGNRGYLFVRVE